MPYRSLSAAIAVLILAVFLLYRRITIIEKYSKFLWVGVVLTILWVIFAASRILIRASHSTSTRCIYSPARILYRSGRGSAYFRLRLLGLLQRQFFRGEVKDPEKTIPRAIIYSILLVSAIYIVMNIAILGVIPWREFVDMAKPENAGVRQYVISTLMERLYGRPPA
jgi:L-asparagine transporter-like permease